MAVAAMAIQGATIIHGAWCMKRRASETIKPHSDAGGWAPRPRNDSVANTITAKATRIVASITMGAATLGSISRSTIQLPLSPRAMAAFTYSCWRTASATERVTRAMLGTTEMAMASAAFRLPLPSVLTRISANSRCGMAIMASTVRMMPSSQRPPR